MKPYTSTLLAALVAGAVAQVQYGPMPTRPAVLTKRRPICIQDSCQEAVDATNFCSCVRLGAEDCSSFLIDTVTVDASTVYSTVVSVYTTSITDSLTLTTLVDATATIITEVEATVTTSVTQTNPVMSAKYGRKRAVGPANMLKKRRSKRMPYYARAACSDEESYESACACRGVYRSTVSVDLSSTTTVTVISASYSPTETASETVSTKTTVRAVATLTATATTTVVATSTAVAQGPFYIKVLSRSSSISGSDVTNMYGRLQYQTSTAHFDYSYLYLNQPSSVGQPTFYVDASGYLRPTRNSAPGDDYYFAYYTPDGASAPLRLWALSDIDDQSYSRIRCSIAAGNVISCVSEDDSTRTAFRTCNTLPVAFFGYDPYTDANCATMTLIAVPA